MKVNENNVKKLKWMGYFYTAVSFFYWVWAIINTIPDPSDFDYGCISFFVVLLSMGILFYRVIPQVEKNEPVDPYVLMLFPVAQCVVVLNYGSSAVRRMEETNTHTFFYVSSFTVLWFVSSVVSYMLLRKYCAHRSDIGFFDTDRKSDRTMLLDA